MTDDTNIPKGSKFTQLYHFQISNKNLRDYKLCSRRSQQAEPLSTLI